MQSSPIAVRWQSSLHNTVRDVKKSRGRPPGQSSKKTAPKTPVPDSTGFAQHERTRSLPPISPIDPGHLDAMQYDFGEVAGNLAASSLPQNADLTAFSDPFGLPNLLTTQLVTAVSSACNGNTRSALNSSKGDSTKEFCEGSESSWNESSIGCPYTILQPVLPHICHMIPPDVACDLLDYFFNDLGVTVFQSRSPYNLANIFRKSSFLRLKEPRSTSPALLAAILFVAAQTCDQKIFRNRTYLRAKICDDLLAITVRLLGDASPELSLSVIPNPLEPVTASPVSRVITSAPTNTGTWPATFQACPNDDYDRIKASFTLDHVVACILCGIVLSGSDLKFECLMWFDKARMMALILELNREQDDKDLSTAIQDILVHEERKEERRRTWWLLYAMDRHLALCYNAPIHLLDTKCQIYQPLGDEQWQQLDLNLAGAQSPHRPFGPPSEISGPGFFQFFLPCMVILGDIVALHHFRLNPRYVSYGYGAFEEVVESALQRLMGSVSSISGTSGVLMGHSASGTLIDKDGDLNSMQIVTAYSTFLIHALAILTYGEWDVITMLDPSSRTLSDHHLAQFTCHTFLASQAMEQILDCDPELTFMPYLLGIYILQVGFAVLVVAEKTGNSASSELQSCIETFIRAHESCIATLDTKYQVGLRD
ncbi:hypothetical protein ZTR_09007 [Talaromyces verruculosus]|nr:hypothetical protein ZTR_09007 [Talaromyces verruculosus]